MPCVHPCVKLLLYGQSLILHTEFIGIRFGLISALSVLKNISRIRWQQALSIYQDEWYM